MTLIVNFIRIIITAYILILLTSCGSHSQKADEAFNRVKKEKMLTPDSNLIQNALRQEPASKPIVKKKEVQDEWTRYKLETEKKIHENENIIREIRTFPKSNSYLLRKVAGLEKENINLSSKLDEFNVEMKMKLENFKALMNHDVYEIGIKLKEVKINIKN
jgi:hypothetical protein